MWVVDKRDIVKTPFPLKYIIVITFTPAATLLKRAAYDAATIHPTVCSQH
jgi:hypothetical protein